jgi:4-amino-4-deoxy-L-arabinose transferase-like glycosyltransferase
MSIRDVQGFRPGKLLSAPVGIFAVALVIRLLACSTLPSLRAPSNDASTYRDLAHNLIHRHLYGTVNDPPHSLSIPYATRPPLVPLSLAAAYLLLGENARTECLLLGSLGALACVVIYILGVELFGSRAGLASAALSSIYPFFLVLSVVPLTESWNVLLYPLLALHIVRFMRRGHMTDAALAGVVLGLSALSKPIIISFAPMLLFMLAVSPGFPAVRTLIKGYITLGLAAAMVLIPWTIRNYLALGTFVPVSLQFGAVLWQGSGPDAGYAVSHLEQGVTNGWDYAPHAGTNERPILDPVAADRHWTRLAVRYIRSDPHRFLNIAVRKERIFWGAYSNRIAQLSWTVLALLSGWGVLLTSSRWRELLPLYILMLHTALIPAFFTSMPRFRAPIEPLLILLAGQAIIYDLDGIRSVSQRLGWPVRRNIDTAVAPDRGEPAPV